MKFSERIGKRPIKTVLQVESIDIDLKNRLWNTIIEYLFNKLNTLSQYDNESQKGEVYKVIWKEFFNKPIDEIPSYRTAMGNHVYALQVESYIKKWFFEAEWFEIYDFIEFVAFIDHKLNLGFIEQCNWALKKEVTGYRIVNNKIVQVTSEEEVQAIEEAAINTDKWKSVNTHLRTALNLLADRKNPNYRNSIKESISAVEALCMIISNNNKATLGEALNIIEKEHSLHGALKKAFSSLYGYTSDSGGIRHSLIETDANVDFDEAKFMLVSCSAFINYLKSKMKI